MPTYIETLTASGLEPSVAAVYVALLELGESQVPAISLKTSLSRASIYEALTHLIAEGYIEYRKEGRNAYYKANHPEKLRDLVAQKKREIALLEGEMGETIRSLAGIFNLSLNKPGIRFFEGIEGLKEIYLDTLTEKQPIYAILSPTSIHPELVDWLDNTYVKKRIEAEIHAQVIVSQEKETTYSNESKVSYRETVTVKNNEFPIDIEINIYGTNRVAFISYSKNEMVGFIIESNAIYNSMKSFFQLAWIQAKSLQQR